MKRTRKYFPVLAVATLAAGLAVVTAPASRAQAQSAPTASSTPQASADTQQRLQDLEKEMLLLQKEIVSLKESETPSMKTAAYTQPAAAGASATALDQAPAAAPAAATPINLAGLLGPTTISGFVDAYYGYNANHPVDNNSGFRFFDQHTNGFAFNMAELIVDKAPDATSTEGRMGYHVAAGYGQAANVVNNSDITSDGSNFYLKEAYGSYLAPVGKGLTITVGKFVTNAGEEVIESNANWNYSRSILFYYAIPFFHFGAKASYTFNPKWSGNVSLVNGWNNSAINHEFTGQSSGLTYGATLTYTPNAKWSASENYYVGPVIGANTFASAVAHPRTYSYWRQISDSVISYTPNTKWAFAVNGDYGYGPRTYNCPSTCTAFGPTQSWWGAAGYAKYTFNPKSYFAARYEYYADPNGYTGLLFGGHGHAQEATGTYAYNLTSGLQVRGEYRYDFASMPIFTRGTVFGAVKEQSTATLGFLYSFSSVNAK
jgi:Putative beta-barrel porin-2, OmpL-like. bbp2